MDLGQSRRMSFTRARISAASSFSMRIFIATALRRGWARKSDRPDMPWHDGLKIAASVLFLASLLGLSLFDLQIQRLPDKIVLPMLALGLANNLGSLITTPTDAFFGAAVGYGSLWTLGTLY